MNRQPYKKEEIAENGSEPFLQTYNVIDESEFKQPKPKDIEILDINWDKVKLPKRIQKVIYRGRSSIHHFNIIGAAGMDDITKTIPAQNLRYMTDPHDMSTRLEFNDAAYTDPLLSTCLEKRNSSTFEDGYDLVFELKSQYDENGIAIKPQGKKKKPTQQSQATMPGQQVQNNDVSQPDDNEEIDPAEELLNQHTAKYGKYLQMIRDWDQKENIKTRQKMRSVHLGGMVQGRSMLLIQPPIKQLATGKLPDALKLLNYQFIGNPIIEYVDTWSLVGVRVLLQSKQIALADEMVYYTAKNWGLRKEADFYGTSLLEPLLIPSRSYRRVINHDLPKGAVAAYLTKMIINLETRGTPADQQNQATNLMNNLTAKSADFVITNLLTKVTPVAPQVDTGFIKMAIDALENILISGIGVTKTMIGREFALNRDIATIQSILYVKHVRKPDEMALAEAFENQLYNPLLAHLCGEDPDKIPVRIVIKRINKPDVDAAEQNEDVQDAASDQMPGDTIAAEQQFASNKEQELVASETGKPDPNQQKGGKISGASKRKKLPFGAAPGDRQLIERTVKVLESQNDYSHIR